MEDTHIGNETALEKAQKTSRDVETLLSLQPGLTCGDDGPRNHLDGNPHIGAELLRYHLRRQLREQEAHVEYDHAVFVPIRQETQVVEHIVGQGLVDIAGIELQGEEHGADPRANLSVQLPIHRQPGLQRLKEAQTYPFHESLVLFFGPLRRRIIAVPAIFLEEAAFSAI